MLHDGVTATLFSELTTMNPLHLHVPTGLSVVRWDECSLLCRTDLDRCAVRSLPSRGSPTPTNPEVNVDSRLSVALNTGKPLMQLLDAMARSGHCRGLER